MSSLSWEGLDHSWKLKAELTMKLGYCKCLDAEISSGSSAGANRVLNRQSLKRTPNVCFVCKFQFQVNGDNLTYINLRTVNDVLTTKRKEATCLQEIDEKRESSLKAITEVIQR